MKPRLFIGSSTESLDVAYAAQEALEADAEVTVWTQGITDLSKYILESLLETIGNTDFALFVFAPDDLTTIRGHQHQTVRDNVILELGLLVGSLGRERSFILIPKATRGLRLPTDLLGITPGTYDPERHDKNLVAALGPVCNRIRKAIAKLPQRHGVKTFTRGRGPRVYTYEEFIEIEKSAKEEVWILRPHYLLEVDSFYDVVAENLSRKVRYRYFVHPEYNFTDELKLLIQRFARDERISADPAELISVEQLGSTDIPTTFVIIDPTSLDARGFAIFENELRGPDYWIEISSGQVTRFVASKLKEAKTT